MPQILSLNCDTSMCFVDVVIYTDVVTNRKMLERVVAKKTLRCDCCCNGSEAVDAVTNKGINYYDLIFMDNVMPVMVSGYN